MKFIVLILTTCSLSSLAQDTIKLEPSTIYTSYDYPFRDESFYSMVEKGKQGKVLTVYS